MRPEYGKKSENVNMSEIVDFGGIETTGLNTTLAQSLLGRADPRSPAETVKRNLAAARTPLEIQTSSSRHASRRSSMDLTIVGNRGYERFARRPDLVVEDVTVGHAPNRTACTPRSNEGVWMRNAATRRLRGPTRSCRWKAPANRPTSSGARDQPERRRRQSPAR